MIHKLALMIFALALSQTLAKATSFDCSPKSPIQWEPLSEGVSWAEYDLVFTPYFKEEHRWGTTLNRQVTVRAIRLDLNKAKLLFHRASADLNCRSPNDRYIHKLIEDSSAPVIAAINASFFVMPNGKTLGLALDEQKLWSDHLDGLTISSAGVFGIENGVPFLKTREEFIQTHGSTLSQADAALYSFAVQAYPKLIMNSEISITDAVKDVKLPRTSIGVAKNTSEIVLVTIDADKVSTTDVSSKSGMTLFEYANFVKNDTCGVAQAQSLNLDGAGSTSFAIPSKETYLQSDPCRHLGNILTVQKR